MLISDNFTSESIYDELKSLSPNVNDTILLCWPPPASTREPDSCQKFFSPVFTVEGLCFTFNSLNSNDVYTDV